jgi:hypothetical protein
MFAPELSQPLIKVNPYKQAGVELTIALLSTACIIEPINNKGTRRTAGK